MNLKFKDDKNKDGFIYDDSYTGKEINFTVGGVTFPTHDKNILVKHKQQIKVMPMKDVGQGMEVFRVSETNFDAGSENIKVSDSFLDGLTMINQFEEEYGSFTTKISNNKELLVSLSKFTQLQSNNYETSMSENKDSLSFKPKTINHWHNIETFIKEIENNKLSNAVEFFIGLTLGYGTLDIKKSHDGATLFNGIKIHLPIVQSLFGKQEILENFISKLHTQNFLIKLDTLKGTQFDTIQIVTQDYQILDSLKSFVISNIKPTPEGFAIEDKITSFEYTKYCIELAKNHDEQTKQFIESLNNKTVKIWKK